MTNTAPIVVVGGGIAGLIAARVLAAVPAAPPVLLFEAAPQLGGRVHTRRVAGYTLDAGFQVLFEGYPTLRSHLDLAALEMRWFVPGARIVDADGTVRTMGDALADPALLWPSLTQGAMAWPDLLRLLSLRQFARSLDDAACFAPPYCAISTLDFLRERGFSSRAIARFFAPFYGGILLDRSLASSASVLLFTLRMLGSGRTGVPAHGMGAVATQLASALAPSQIRTSTVVRAITAEQGRATGVVLTDGSHTAASAVVLATDAPTAVQLAATAGVALALPIDGRAVRTFYFGTRTSCLRGRALWLNADPAAVVSHAVTMSDVAAEYAPAGQHLIAASTLGPDADEAGVRADLVRMSGREFPGDGELLAVDAIPFAQFDQPPRATRLAISPTTALPGLVLAGEYLHSSSLEGAAIGGTRGADAVLSYLAL
ncbi:MAG: NAD(P)/FAD-dependent oxidoreductase [Gemmatimonadaceae bacterium]|nr:NAD(P)/FAD-dependent oxidoreductase [Gemmatimonadaceae bacterium]